MPYPPLARAPKQSLDLGIESDHRHAIHTDGNVQLVRLCIPGCMNTHDMVDNVIANPLVMIASDGEDGHPRNAGTFSRILARYVRERGSMTLMDAIRKMSLMPAERLGKSTVSARRKGRLQEGADADIIAFDPRTVAAIELDSAKRSSQGP